MTSFVLVTERVIKCMNAMNVTGTLHRSCKKYIFFHVCVLSTQKSRTRIDSFFFPNEFEQKLTSVVLVTERVIEYMNVMNATGTLHRSCKNVFSFHTKIPNAYTFYSPCVITISVTHSKKFK